MVPPFLLLTFIFSSLTLFILFQFLSSLIYSLFRVASVGIRSRRYEQTSSSLRGTITVSPPYFFLLYYCIFCVSLCLCMYVCTYVCLYIYIYIYLSVCKLVNLSLLQEEMDKKRKTSTGNHANYFLTHFSL